MKKDKTVYTRNNIEGLVISINGIDCTAVKKKGRWGYVNNNSKVFYEYAGVDIAWNLNNSISWIVKHRKETNYEIY